MTALENGPVHRPHGGKFVLVAKGIGAGAGAAASGLDGEGGGCGARLDEPPVLWLEIDAPAIVDEQQPYRAAFRTQHHAGARLNALPFDKPGLLKAIGSRPRKRRIVGCIADPPRP